MNITKLGFKILNPTINLLLRSPLYFTLSKRIMAIEYTGIRSGKKFSIPVSYFKQGDHIYCFTNGNWWRNFKIKKQVRLIINKNKKSASAVVVLNDDACVDVLSDLIQKFPSDARYYGVKLDSNNKPLVGELALAIDNNKLIQFSDVF